MHQNSYKIHGITTTKPQSGMDGGRGESLTLLHRVLVVQVKELTPSNSALENNILNKKCFPVITVYQHNLFFFESIESGLVKKTILKNPEFTIGCSVFELLPY